VARLILDTSVIVAAERGRISLDDVIQPADDVGIAAVTAAELLLGVELAAPNRQVVRQSAVELQLRSLTIVDYTLTVARWHARLIAHARNTGKTRGSHDLIIGATAVAMSRSIVTFDAGFTEMPGVSVRLLDPPARKERAT